MDHTATAPAPDDRAAAARNLVGLLAPLLADDGGAGAGSAAAGPPACDVLSAIKDLVCTLIPGKPILAAFHDGRVHDPLGGGSYAFRDDIVGPVLAALVNDEKDATGMPNSNDPPLFPTRPIVIHAGLQPNNSPHAGTLAVFCYAFLVARGLRDRMQAQAAAAGRRLPAVSVEIGFVDTAPVGGQGVEVDGIQYQRSHRAVPGALDAYMAEYNEVLGLLSAWSDVPFATATQHDLFAHAAMPALVGYVLGHHDRLGHQLSPKHGTLGLRAACPVPGCGLAEKHGRLNVYHVGDADGAATITFHCPHHGPHTMRVAQRAELAWLEANAPVRNLLRSMRHLVDADTHHVRVTGADYAGMYQEAFLYRPLAAWSAATGCAAGRTPHILYAPLVVDWSGAKLSKALYVCEGGYDAMALFGTDGLCSFARLKSEFGSGADGLRRIWDEVHRWMDDPKKLFRTFSVEYLNRAIREAGGAMAEGTQKM